VSAKVASLGLTNPALPAYEPPGRNNKTMSEIDVSTVTGVNVDERQAFDDLLAHIRRERGLDYGQYKDSFLYRRLAARMRAREIDTYHKYLRLLRSDPAELDELLDALNINVSYFFRDESAFAALRYGVLMPLMAQQAAVGKNRVAIWSAGCATGEEPYSVAMLVAELLGSDLRQWNILIHATDIDADALAQARRGTYKAHSFQDPETDLVERYFTKNDDTYVLEPTIRQLVSFKKHDLTASPPLPHYNLILCRNILIYFAREHQEEIVRHLLDHLELDGYLMLGMSEMLPLALVGQLEVVDGRLRIYRKPKWTKEDV
jgi:chemotaxis methyl-accepting protein methylase